MVTVFNRERQLTELERGLGLTDTIIYNLQEQIRTLNR